MAAKVNVEPERQVHRNNAPTNENENQIESYFLRNLAIPFLDSINMKLDERFSNVVQQCSGLLRLIPSVITNKNGNFAITDQQIREAIQLFEDDLPHPNW